MHPAFTAQNDPNFIREQVRQGYGAIARTGGFNPSAQPSTPQSSCCGGGGCCGPATLSADDLAAQLGYTTDELQAIPEGANLGLSCGNPTAIAALKPGETVLDLGSGAGFDVFLAGPKVGPSGRAIGVDMTPDMLNRARQNLAGYRAQTGLNNVEFRLGEIEHLPVADGAIDCVISNCVINLSIDKAQVWKEIARVLKPGGRVSISDLMLFQPLPPAIAHRLDALIGCIAGAPLIDDTKRWAKDAGLVDIRVESHPPYVESMVRSSDPLFQQIRMMLPPGTTASQFITSAMITARKPA